MLEYLQGICATTVSGGGITQMILLEIAPTSWFPCQLEKLVALR